MCRHGRALPPASARQGSASVGNLDINLKGRNFIATTHLHVDAIGFYFDMSTDGGKNFVTQDIKKI
jgi:hypothetical protein